MTVQGVIQQGFFRRGQRLLAGLLGGKPDETPAKRQPSREKQKAAYFRGSRSMTPAERAHRKRRKKIADESRRLNRQR
jgi:hypothetical protein